MKTLTLLRHAKSSWDDLVQRDFDRPLNGRGCRAGACIGTYIRDHDLHFDAIIASPAMRVRETIASVEEGCGRPLGHVTYDEAIYMASADTLLDLVRRTPDEQARLFLIGHNPGLEDLVLDLTPKDAGGLRDEVEIKYPTATLAELVFDADHWADLKKGTARLTRFVRPRDLDPSLGPQETG